MKCIYTIDLKVTQELNDLISADSIKEIYSLALSSHPRECCGLILKRGIRPCENVQDYLHQLDPVKHPRNSTNGFTFSAQDALFLSRNVDSANPVQIIYHSHPDVGAYFSDEDKQNALFDGAPIYPVDHLVIDVQSSGVICSKLFRFMNGDYELIAILPGNNDK